MISRSRSRTQILPQHEVVGELRDGLLALQDLGDVREGVFDPLSEEARAHRGVRLVEDPQQRPALFLGEHRLGQLEIAPRREVHFEELRGLVDVQLAQIRNVLHLRVADVFEGGSDGDEGGPGTSGGDLHPELLFRVTRIGCGIAGFTNEEIAPLFKAACEMENVSLPNGWREMNEE